MLNVNRYQDLNPTNMYIPIEIIQMFVYNNFQAGNSCLKNYDSVMLASSVVSL